jgi:hypothetical protein
MKPLFGGTPATASCTRCSIVLYGLWMWTELLNWVFFINHLHRHIEKLHHEQFGDGNTAESFIVHRGQGMSKAAFK